MKKPLSWQRRGVGLLASNGFFWCVVALLVLQAAWIALSGRYPMAFDEDFHFGIIKLYAHHVSPFWSGQPENADMFGAVARDPSYLYQWLMSFPYRLISLFMHDQTAQIILMRFINIGLFASALPLYRRLLLKTTAGRAIVHLVLLLFVLLPIVPLLAAQINYDNLMLPWVALSALVCLSLAEEFRGSGSINVKKLGWLVVLCLAGSLIKYAFLPIALAYAVFLGVLLARRLSWRKFWTGLGVGISLLSRRLRVALLVLIILLGGLFFERYGLNMVHYHTPLPDCGKVLSAEQCSEYGPWIRDFNLAQTHARAPQGPIIFTNDWFYGMWLRTFFAVDGPATHFETRGPLTLPGIGSIIFAAGGFSLFLIYARRLWRRYDSLALWLFTSVTAIYVALLWFDEYLAYVRTGQPVAINGRYLLSVLPFVMIMMALAYREWLKTRPRLQVGLAGLAVLCLLWGGGVMTYVLRSRSAWYWPNGAVNGTNRAVRDVFGPLTPGYRRPTAFMH